MEKQVFKHNRSLENNSPEIEKLENRFGPVGTNYIGSKGRVGLRIVGFSPKKDKIIIKNSSEKYFRKSPEELQKIIESNSYERVEKK